MKRYIKLILSALSIWAFNACTYDYEMPDYSDAVGAIYSVGKVSSEMQQALIKDVKDYDLDLIFQSGTEQWRTVVREKDKNGVILYEGEPRGKADKNATTLEVSYVYSCMFKIADWGCYDICHYDFQKKFKLEISPFAHDAKLSLGDSYIAKEAPNCLSIYTVEHTLSAIAAAKADSLGYKFTDVNMYITEKIEERNILRSLDYRNNRKTEDILTIGKYIDVEVKVNGSYNAINVPLGAFHFENVPIGNKTAIKLTENMDHEFMVSEFITNHHIYNVDRSDLTQMLIQKCESLGYSIADAKMYITEKDSDGNALRTFQHEAIDGDEISQEGAAEIDVKIDVYGFVNMNKTLLGTYYFKNIPLDHPATIKLTEDMEHEFVVSDFIASHYIYNVDRSDLTQMLIQKCESLGYSIADAKMYITEKDKDGNVLRTFQHEAINGEVTSAKDAVTIDVEVEVYAFISAYQKKKIGSYVFKSIKLEDIQHSTLKLSADMEHEFVSES